MTTVTMHSGLFGLSLLSLQQALGPSCDLSTPTRCVPAPGPLGWPQHTASALLRLWLSRSLREEGAPHRPHWAPLESGQQPLVTSLV